MKTIITEIRLSKDVTFFEWATETIQYIDETFVKTGKLINREINYSDDGLTKTIGLEFSSAETAKEFTTDPTLIEARSKKLTHDVENKIRILRS
jgi:predicted chitinase